MTDILNEDKIFVYFSAAQKGNAVCYNNLHFIFFSGCLPNENSVGYFLYCAAHQCCAFCIINYILK